MFVIDYIFCSDVPNIEIYVPNDSSEVFYTIELEVKWMNEKETSVFQVVVTTPEALQLRMGRCDISESKRGYLVLREYAWNTALSQIQLIMNSAVIKNDKEKSLARLSQKFRWEYD